MFMFGRLACKTYVGDTAKPQNLCEFCGGVPPKGGLQTLCSSSGGLSYKPYVRFVDLCPARLNDKPYVRQVEAYMRNACRKRA